MDKVVLRPIGRGDIEHVISLQNTSLPITYSRERVWDKLFDRYERHSFVAAGTDGTIAGFVLSWDNVVVALAVGAKYRRHSIGRNLLRLCVNSHFPECVRLHVGTSNVAAQKLYVDSGFVEKQHCANFYTNPAGDALLFERASDSASWFTVPYEIILT